MTVPGEVPGKVPAHDSKAGDTDLSEFSHLETLLWSAVRRS
jgi:hypothetical protein